MTAKGSAIGDDRIHTGYAQSRYGSSIKTSGNYDYQDGNEYDKEREATVFSTYGWTCLDLFNFKTELKRGTYKIPLYKPPTIINMDPRDIPQLERIKDTMVWLRIAHPREDEINEVRCEPSYYHIYYVPEIHNIAPKVEMYTKPERDPTYHCEGVQMFMHYAKGWENVRHMRISIAMQVGKDILM
jgi:hypothetical protein